MDNNSVTKLIFIRHGQSLANVTGAFAGHSDIPLSHEGIMQARATACYLKDEKIDIIYSSDLSRAYDTAREIDAYHHCGILKDSRLREIHGGSWEGKTYLQISRQYPQVYAVWKNNIGFVALPHGENTCQLQDRIYRCVKEISVNNIGNTILFSITQTFMNINTAKC